MLINKALKVRIYPNKAQAEKIDATFGCCRYIYNEMLSRNQKVYQRRGEHLSYIAMQNLLPALKKYKPWLQNVDSQALKNACRHLDTAYKKFFRHEAGFPKYHRKHGTQSYTTTQIASIKINGKKLQLPCLGWIKAKGSRHLPENSKICMAAVSREPDGKYYVSISYKYEVEIQPVTFYASLSREDDTVKLDLSIQITDYYEYVIQRIPDQNVVYLPIESWYAPWKGAYTIDRCFSEAFKTYEEAEKFIKNMPEHSQEYVQRWGYGFGYRRRVQICDLSNVNTDWYQNQLKTLKAAKEKGIDLLDEKFFAITATQHYENITGEELRPEGNTSEIDN